MLPEAPRHLRMQHQGAEAASERPTLLRPNVDIIQSSNTDKHIRRRRQRHAPPSVRHPRFSLPRPWLLVAAGLSLPSDKAPLAPLWLFLFHLLSIEQSIGVQFPFFGHLSFGCRGLAQPQKLLLPDATLPLFLWVYKVCALHCSLSLRLPWQPSACPIFRLLHLVDVPLLPTLILSSPLC
jgi:hypothetical protein